MPTIATARCNDCGIATGSTCVCATGETQEQEEAREKRELAAEPATRTAWFTFGVGHHHEIDGEVFDGGTMVEITAADPRLVMLGFFGTAWSSEYDEARSVEYRAVYVPRLVAILPVAL